MTRTRINALAATPTNDDSQFDLANREIGAPLAYIQALLPTISRVSQTGNVAGGEKPRERDTGTSDCQPAPTLCSLVLVVPQNTPREMEHRCG
jgi:hypothetical protein